MSNSTSSENGEHGLPMQDLNGTRPRRRAEQDEEEERPTSPFSRRPTISESSDPGNTGFHNRRQNSRASINYFSQKRRASQSTVRSSSLTPAEAALIFRNRSNSLGQVQSSPVRGSFDKSVISEELDDLLSDEMKAEIEDLWSSKFGPPLPTTKTLLHFKKVAVREIDPEVQMKREKDLERAKMKRNYHKFTLDRLRKWAKWREAQNTIIGRIRSYFTRSEPLPGRDELIELVKYYYPKRADVILYVCDFGEDYFNFQKVRFGDIDDYMESKPPQSKVRWIHAPFGPGLVHSSLEEVFLASADRTLATVHSNRKSFPYVQFETTTLRQREELETMRDIINIMRYYRRDLKEVTKELDDTCLEGLSEVIKNDIEWRANHHGEPLGYWELVTSDFQRQLTSGQSHFVSPMALEYAVLDMEKQALADFPFYESAQLVRYAFRCFHRSDGFLLTLAPSTGIDYINRDLPELLDLPKEVFHDYEDISSIGLLLQLFSADPAKGTNSWDEKHVDWFLIYILTEVAASPNVLRQGYNAPQLPKAYQIIVEDLKKKRYQDFKPNESVKLVRSYLSCIDELANLEMVFKHSLEMLKTLKIRLDEKQERQKGEQPNEEGRPTQEAGESSRKIDSNPVLSSPGKYQPETAMARIEWATAIVKTELYAFEELLQDLRQSYTALFQLRSIEQNEIAIRQDNMNKAVLVFTAVTIVFLPLNFFTSYYGMNVKGIIDNKHGVSYFWKLCGTIAFIIILAVSLYAFRHRIRNAFAFLRDPHGYDIDLEFRDPSERMV